MKNFYILALAILTSCSYIPFLAQGIEEAVEFEEDAIKDEIKIREKHHNENAKK